MNYKIKLSAEKELEFYSGEFIAISGDSGSGKTTLLKKIAQNLKENKISVGFVLQDVDAQIITDKVWHELCFSLENEGLKKEAMSVRIAEMANYFGLQSFIDNDISTLSGGQKQLLNLASVMATCPEVLILDEPTSQLDPMVSEVLLKIIKKINDDFGTTIIICDYRIEEIFDYCDKYGFLNNGKIEFYGTTEELLKFVYKSNSELKFYLPVPTRIFYEGELDRFHKFDRIVSVRDCRNLIENTFKNNSSEIKTNNKIDFGDCIIKAKNIWFRYKRNEKDIVRDLSINIPRKKITAIVGGNGSGKTTFLKLLAGILTQYSGKINLDKISLNNRFSDILLLPQNPKNVLSKNSVLEELAEMFSEGQTINDSEIKKIVLCCRLDNLINVHPFDLSVGEIQRLVFAKVLIKNPKILLLDEPSKGMDNAYKYEFSKMLKKCTEKGMTIIFVSHDIEFTAYTADYVGLMFNGRIDSLSNTVDFFSSNNFYSTISNKICRKVFPNVITIDDAINSIKGKKL